jgi:hypothetical protein
MAYRKEKTMSTQKIKTPLRREFEEIIHDESSLAALRSAPTVPSIGPCALPGEVQPDFATLFALNPQLCALHEDCEHEQECEYQVSPRLAHMIYTNAEINADYFVASQEEFLDSLPPLVERFLSGLDDLGRDAWWKRFCASFLWIADCIAVGQIPRPRCTGEEMALHVVLLATGGEVQDEFEAYDDDENFHSLPGNVPADEDIEWISEVWFEDHDVLMLFDPQLDGIESIDDETNAVLGIANLHPKDWFIPFRRADSTF